MNTTLAALLIAAINNAQTIAQMVSDAANGKQHTPEDLQALDNDVQSLSQKIQAARTDL